MKTYRVHAFAPGGEHLGDVVAPDYKSALERARQLWGQSPLFVEFEMDLHGAILEVRIPHDSRAEKEGRPWTNGS